MKLLQKHRALLRWQNVMQQPVAKDAIYRFVSHRQTPGIRLHAEMVMPACDCHHLVCYVRLNQ